MEEGINYDLRQELVSKAREVVSNAYAPYSNFSVGSAVLTKEGNIFTGCNVENVSFALTSCAERNAIFSAVGFEGATKMKIQAVAVVNVKNTFCPPCGACRQVIYEFGPDAEIFLDGENGIQTFLMSNLLPGAFKSLI